MSLIRLANGHKYEIEQPNEGEGMMRNRRRNTVQITFRAGAEQFDAIRADITPENLDTFTIYYPDNETADEPDEQLAGVAHKDFSAYALVGDWEDKERARAYEANGRVWSYDDLNRIESALLGLYTALTAQQNARQTLAFTMGGGIFGACV